MGNNWDKLLDEDTKNWWIDRMYLQDAVAAAIHSPDPRTQVGTALVVPNGLGVVLKSWNAPLESLSAYPPEWKNHCTEHAERRVIYTAISNGLPLEGLTLYCTWASCAECARAIIHFGIKRVVTLRRLVECTPERWSDSVVCGLRMMRDRGIQTVGWSGDLNTKYNIRFNGQTVGNEDFK